MQLEEGLSFFSYPHDLSVASGTGWCKELFVTALTVHAVLLFHKAHIGQGCLAVSTVEFFWMPRATHGYQERTPINNRHYRICIAKRLNDPGYKPTLLNTTHVYNKHSTPTMKVRIKIRSRSLNRNGLFQDHYSNTSPTG